MSPLFKIRRLPPGYVVNWHNYSEAIRCQPSATMKKNTTTTRRSPKRSTLAPVIVQVHPHLIQVNTGENDFKIVAQNCADYAATTVYLIEALSLRAGQTGRKVSVSFYNLDGTNRGE